MPYLLPTSILGFNLDWVPASGRLIWFSVVLSIGLLFTYLAMNPARFELPFSKARLLIIAIIGMIIVYAIGVFVEPLQILGVWVNIALFVFAVSLLLLTTTIPKETTWAQTILGGIWVFFMMAVAYAMIPHEFITLASGYFGMTADRLFVDGGSEFPNIFTNFPKHILPFEVSYEVLQDFVTVGIYVVLATINVKIFALWQKREFEFKPKSTGSEEPSAELKAAALKAKISAFGRPIKKADS
jgi:hypothetical protein